MAQQEDRNIFASKFQDFGSMPSDAVWKGIEAAIPQEKKRRGIIWWWSAGFAATFIGVIMWITFYSNVEESKESNAVTSNEISGTSTAQSSSQSDRKSTNIGQSQKSDLDKKVNRDTSNEDRTNEKLKEPEFKRTATANKTKAVLDLQAQNTGTRNLSGVTSSNEAERMVMLSSSPDSSEVSINKDEQAAVTRNWKEKTGALLGPLNHDNNSDLKNRIWWIGFTVEQNQQASTVEKKSEPVGSVSSAPQAITSEFDWTRSRSLAMIGGVDWNKRWSFGTGFEYTHWDNLKSSSFTSGPSFGKSVGVPVFVNWRFIAKPGIQVGAQLELKQRFFFKAFDSIVPSNTAYYDLNTEIAFAPSKSFSSFQAFQSQFAVGLTTEVPFLKKFSWKTTLSYQNSLYRSSAVSTRVNGSWLGVNSGILFRF